MSPSLAEMIRIAKVFSSDVTVNQDCNLKIYVGIRMVSYKEDRNDPMARSLIGRGATLEDACFDFLTNARGRILFGDSPSFYGKTPPEYLCI